MVALRTVMSTQRRNHLLARIDALCPQAPRRWGRMTAHEMVCHLSDQLRSALGIMPTRIMHTPLRHPVVRWISIYMTPPRDRFLAPAEALTSHPKDFEEDRDVLRGLVQELACQENIGRWPQHPYFGRLSGRMWAEVTWKHCDHHLRQFGV